MGHYVAAKHGMVGLMRTGGGAARAGSTPSTPALEGQHTDPDGQHSDAAGKHAERFPLGYFSGAWLYSSCQFHHSYGGVWG